MQDLIYLPRRLALAVQPVAETWGLSTLPLHIHELIIAWVFYNTIFNIVSPIFSAWLFPTVYPQLPARTTVDWNIRVTSLIQSSLIVMLALLVTYYDQERNEMDWAGRIWGYTGAGGLVQALAAGYFLWDLTVSTQHLSILGPSSWLHAASALIVTMLGFRPFANYYGLNFILFEMSTPFLNIHWFLDKLNKTGSRMQLYNGVLLLATFFGFRVLWGNYQTLCIYSDLWTVLHASDVDLASIKDYPTFAPARLAGQSSLAIERRLPIWLVIVYLGSNTSLNVLNIYWFAKMLRALRRRFKPSSASTQKTK